jgi:hypothetical protein
MTPPQAGLLDRPYNGKLVQNSCVEEGVACFIFSRSCWAYCVAFAFCSALTVAVMCTSPASADFRTSTGRVVSDFFFSTSMSSLSS